MTEIFLLFALSKTDVCYDKKNLKAKYNGEIIVRFVSLCFYTCTIFGCTVTIHMKYGPNELVYM